MDHLAGAPGAAGSTGRVLRQAGSRRTRKAAGRARRERMMSGDGVMVGKWGQPEGGEERWGIGGEG